MPAALTRIFAARLLAASMIVAATLAAGEPAAAQSPQMNFFLVLTGPARGADRLELEVSDTHCTTVAYAQGFGHLTWRAYLDGSPAVGQGSIKARDRIGTGPWYNAKGVRIAQNLGDLHSGRNNVTKETALDERGRMVNGRTEKPNRHDILTGSRPDGTALPPSGRFGDMTCSNWTYGGDKGAAMLGHHDRAGPTTDAWAVSWNSAHPSIGCTPGLLAKTGGAGLLYCFAVN